MDAEIAIAILYAVEHHYGHLKGPATTETDFRTWLMELRQQIDERLTKPN